MTASKQVRATLVMEQHLGHLSYYRNLRSVLDSDERLAPTWVEVDYDETAAMISRLPMVPTSLRGSLGGRAQVVNGLRGSNPDIGFFNTQVPAALGFTRLQRLPYVVATDITPRQYDRMADHYGHRQDRDGALSTVKHAMNVRVFDRAKAVVCWSKWCADSVIDEYGVSEERVEVIAPGVDLGAWKPQVKAFRAKPQVLFVGGDLKRKGGLLLIDAFKRLPAGSAELHLVTRSDYVAEVEDIVVHRNLSPNSPELVALFHGSDLFVLPSSAEAFGIAAAEASASGLAVIATGSGGLSDIVVDGETGFIVEPGEVDQLADRLARLVEDRDLCIRMGAASRTRAEHLFDADTNGRRIADLLIQHSVPQRFADQHRGLG